MHDLTRVPSERDRNRFVWAVKCVICRKPIVLGVKTEADALRILGDKPAVHADCRDKPSVKTPELEGFDS